MIERIIQFSIKNKFIVGLCTVALIASGIYSLTQLPIDATPDITNNQVLVISRAPSLAVQEVESSITAPIEVAVANIPNIIELRSISRLGLSVTTIVFKDQTDIYWARQQVSERLKEAEDNIPPGLAKIELAPISTGLGEIYQYRLAVDKAYENKYSPMELRTIQDWTVRREMLGTPGVAEINSYGGYVKQYEIAINPDRLRSFNLTLTDVFDALERNNENTGSAYIDKHPTAFFIRGIGVVKSLSDIEKIVVKSNSNGVPLLIKDVATVQYGNATRYGALVVDTTEAVGGVVMMLKGANASEVVKNVEERVATIQKTLPKGIHIEAFLNRSDLVDRAMSTVARNLTEGALIVIFILVLFLGNFRAGLIVASVIPLAMLFALCMMHIFGVSGNLMSLGAIDFGLIVDGAVIIVESVVHYISRRGPSAGGTTVLSQQEMDTRVFEASSRIRKAATFGEIIILIVYLPILALSGIEGKMFQPMAFVVCFAILGAFLLSLTYVPMVSALFLSKNTVHTPNFSDKMMDKLHSLFNPVLEWTLRKKKLVVISSISIFIASIGLFSTLGGEFIPQLEEGDLAAGVVTLQGGSLSNTLEQVQKANKILLDSFPEIKHAVCKIGAGEIPTDPTPMETGDYIITLKPKSEWTSAETLDELVARMENALIPLAGVKFEFQQPIQMRTNELLSGSKQDIAIKIFGDDLNTLAVKAEEVEKIIRRIEGVEDINVEKVTGLAQIQVEYNRDRLAQYGLSVAELNKILRTAFAGSEAGMVMDEEKRFAMVVRLDKDYRQDIDNIRSLSVNLPGGGQIPSDQLADIDIKSGPAQVSREDTKRRITVGFNVRNRDIESVIKEVSAGIDSKIQFPSGYYVSYGGQFKNLEAAKDRLAIAVPIALLLIFVLLYFSFNSIKQSLLIFSAVPMASIGGILALWLRGMNFSISAGVGFIALFGVAVLNGIVLIAEFNRLEQDGITDIVTRVRKGLHSRLRPVIMTATVASLGFMPMALSTSAGAEVQKPLATVVIGGLISSTLLTLLILPVFYIYSRQSRRRRYTKTIGMILLLATTSGGLNAQTKKTIGLKEAIDGALANNLTVRSARQQVEISKALKGAAWDLPKANIDAQYGQFNSVTKDNSVAISQSMAFPVYYIRQSKLANATVTRDEWKKKQTELDIATQVKQLYWQLSYLYSKQRLLMYQDSLYKGFRKAAELRSQLGETNQLEMISARSQSMEISNQLRQMTADIQINAQRLALLINSRQEVVPTDTVLIRLGSPLLKASNEGTHPALAGYQQELEMSRLETRVEASKWLPELSLGIQSQTIQGVQEVNGAPKSFGPSDRFSFVQAGISVPLWIQPFQARLKAARLKEKAAQTDAELQVAGFTNAYQTLLLEYNKNNSNVAYYEQQALPEANLIISRATQSYHAGAMDYLDYLQNLNRALGIKQNYLDAINACNQTIISLDYMQGKID